MCGTCGAYRSCMALTDRVWRLPTVYGAYRSGASLTDCACLRLAYLIVSLSSIKTHVQKNASARSLLKCRCRREESSRGFVRFPRPTARRWPIWSRYHLYLIVGYTILSTFAFHALVVISSSFRFKCTRTKLFVFSPSSL